MVKQKNIKMKLFQILWIKFLIITLVIGILVILTISNIFLWYDTKFYKNISELRGNGWNECLSEKIIYYSKQGGVQETQIFFDSSLNESERKCAKNMIKDINNFFLLPIKNITFSKNQSFVGEKGGVNYKDSIKVLYKNEPQFMRELLCHEILHSWVERGDLEENMVDYISTHFMPCYYEYTNSYEKGNCSLAWLAKLGETR